jgi:nucleotide-binding universal stress UspA family protein
VEATLQAGRGFTLLAGVDGGRSTAAVVQGAADLADWFGALLLVAHVASRGWLLAADGPGPVPHAGAFDESESAALCVFPTVVEALAASNVDWRFAGAVGDPARELARLARDQGVGAVVVGASARGPKRRLRRIGRGSVAAGLAHLQTAPVIVLPAGCSRPAAPARRTAW